MGLRESFNRLSGQVVISPGLHRNHPTMQACQRQCVVAHRAHVVLGLPHASTLYAGAGVKRVDDPEPEEVLGVRRRRDEQAPLRRTDVGSVYGCFPKEKPEAGTSGTKL